MATPSIQISEAIANSLSAVSGWSAERVSFPMVRKENVPASGFLIQVVPNGYNMNDGVQARGLFVEDFSVAVTIYRKARTLAESDQALLN